MPCTWRSRNPAPARSRRSDVDGELRVVEVVLVERVELDTVRERKHVDARHLASQPTQCRADVASRTAEVEDAAPGLDDLQGERVRAVELEPRPVAAVRLGR